MESGEPVGLPWVTIWAFVRIGTNSRAFANPRSARESFAIVSEWLAQPGVTALNPGPLHAAIFERVVCGHKVMGPLVTDAALAAIAIEYGATLASTDQDFRRFADLKYVNPLDTAA
jgi:toxin-antitoxin system PIN domain toxin